MKCTSIVYENGHFKKVLVHILFAVFWGYESIYCIFCCHQIGHVMSVNGCGEFDSRCRCRDCG